MLREIITLGGGTSGRRYDRQGVSKALSSAIRLLEERVQLMIFRYILARVIF